MAEIVYILCALTSILCAFMLFRSYANARLPILFWSCVCFSCMALTNVILFIDLIMLPDYDLQLLRECLNAAAVATLIYGITIEVI